MLKEIRFNEDRIKALNAKEKLLTKNGRNRFIFGLGLRAEPYFKHPEFLTDDNLDEIFVNAFGNPDVYDLIESLEEANMKHESE